MASFVLPPSASAPLPSPPEGHEPVAPGGVFLVPASTWRFEEDIEPLLTAIRAAPWAPLVIVEDVAEMPRGLGGDAVYLFGEAADIVRVASPPPSSSPRPTTRYAALRTRGVPSSATPTDGTVRSQVEPVPPPVEAVLVQVRAAARARPIPDAAMIGRLLNPTFDAELVDSLVTALGQGVARPGLSRRFRTAGLPAPRVWFAAMRAIRAVAYAFNQCTNQEIAARTEGHTGVTLSTACRKYLRLDWKRIGSVLAWEGLVEMFLRARGATSARRQA